MLQKLNIIVRKGSVENIPIRIESGLWRYAPIEAIERSAPLRITATDHGIPDGWRVAIMNARVLGEFAAQTNPPKDRDLRPAIVPNADTVEFNKINGAAFKPHTGGGHLAWLEPMDLSPFIGARMNLRAKVKGALLANWTTETGELEIDTANRALWLRLSAEQTEALTPGVKVFDIELIRPVVGPDRICAFDSTLVVLDETTTE